MNMSFDLAMSYLIGCLVKLGEELTRRSPNMLELSLVTFCDVPVDTCIVMVCVLYKICETGVCT